MSARGDQVRLLATLAQCEMALVRRDAVAVALLAQARRMAEGLPADPLVAAAADLSRTTDLSQPTPAARAARKVAQALCRAALNETEAALLG